MNNEPKTILLLKTFGTIFQIATTTIAVSALIVGLRLYSLYKEQHHELKNSTEQLLNQEKKISELQHINETQTQQLSEQNDLLNKTTSDIQTIKDTFSANQNKVSAIEIDMKDWQKDYVTVLAEAEQKSNSVIKQLDDLNEQIKNIKAQVAAQNTTELEQKVNSLKFSLEQIISSIPSTDPIKQSIQRRLYPDLLK